MENKIKHGGGCGCCPKSNDVLAMDTVLYNGFGGYTVYLNDEVYFQGNPNDNFDSFPTLRKFEMIARKNDGKWEVVLNNPLRGATWFRTAEDVWTLTETNQGFA